MIHLVQVLLIQCFFLGVEDDETIAEFLKESGEFQATFTNLSYINGYVRIEVEQSLIGDAAILMGGTDDFEHFLVQFPHMTFKVPKGNFSRFQKAENFKTFFRSQSQAIGKRSFAPAFTIQVCPKQDCNCGKGKQNGLHCNAILD